MERRSEWDTTSYKGFCIDSLTSGGCQENNALIGLLYKHTIIVGTYGQTKSLFVNNAALIKALIGY